MSTDDSPEREVVVYDREGYPRASVEDEEGPSNVSEKEDVSNPLNSTEKTKSCRTPRREVRWLDLGARNRSLESIKQRFQDRLDRFLSSSNSLLRHITSPMDSKLIHNLHQCPGYLREEITLASDVSKSVIVSHAFPSQSEVCSICGQLVQYNRTEPSNVDGEKLGVPRYPSQSNLQNMASLLPLSSSMKDASNISEIQPETHPETRRYSASYSWSHTQSRPLDTEDMGPLPLSPTMRDQIHPSVLEFLRLQHTQTSSNTNVSINLNSIPVPVSKKVPGSPHLSPNNRSILSPFDHSSPSSNVSGADGNNNTHLDDLKSARAGSSTHSSPASVNPPSPSQDPNPQLIFPITYDFTSQPSPGQQLASPHRYESIFVANGPTHGYYIRNNITREIATAHQDPLWLSYDPGAFYYDPDFYV